jgi:hypothetical protein
LRQGQTLTHGRDERHWCGSVDSAALPAPILPGPMLDCAGLKKIGGSSMPPKNSGHREMEPVRLPIRMNSADSEVSGRLAPSTSLGEPG